MKDADGEREMMMNMRIAMALAMAAVVSMGATGCATKKYVRNQNAPLIDHEKQLDEKVDANGKRIDGVDQSAQNGIKEAKDSAEFASQSAKDAGGKADAAQSTANDAVHRVDALESVVKGLDSYKSVDSLTVYFGLSKDVLSASDKDQLDAFAAKIGQSGYILEVTGGTDASGSAEANYQLSQRRANAVVAYLVAKHNIPAHRFYLIGIGKDKEVASNKTAAGRKQNRRVTIELLSNSVAK
jgi:outer membrane protein OmpA-like peptidoglycan-associated protein